MEEILSTEWGRQICLKVSVGTFGSCAFLWVLEKPFFPSSPFFDELRKNLSFFFPSSLFFLKQGKNLHLFFPLLRFFT
jgi:hypothetical protein